MDVITGFDLGIFLTTRAVMFAVVCFVIWYIVLSPTR